MNLLATGMTCGIIILYLKAMKFYDRLMFKLKES